MSEIQNKYKKRLKLNQYAMDQSYDQFVEAIKENNQDEINMSVGHLLLWTIAIDDWHLKHGNVRYKNRKRDNHNGVILLGIRFAYNALKHNMSFVYIAPQKGGSTLPMTFPFSIKPIHVLWTHNNNVDVTDKEHPNQRNNYVNYLEEKVVKKTFNQVFTFLNEENKNYLS